MGETPEHEPAPQPPGPANGQADGLFDGVAAPDAHLQRPSPAPSGMSRLVSGFSNLSRVASGVSAHSMQRQISARAPLDVEKLGDGELLLGCWFGHISSAAIIGAAVAWHGALRLHSLTNLQMSAPADRLRRPLQIDCSSAAASRLVNQLLMPSRRHSHCPQPARRPRHSGAAPVAGHRRPAGPVAPALL